MGGWRTVLGVGEAMVLQFLPANASPAAQWQWYMATIFADREYAILLPLGAFQPVLNAEQSIVLSQEGHC